MEVGLLSREGRETYIGDRACLAVIYFWKLSLGVLLALQVASVKYDKRMVGTKAKWSCFLSLGVVESLLTRIRNSQTLAV